MKNQNLENIAESSENKSIADFKDFIPGYGIFNLAYNRLVPLAEQNTNVNAVAGYALGLASYHMATVFTALTLMPK